MAQNSGFVPQITLTDSAESYIRKKGDVRQHSRIGDYGRMPTLKEQGPRRTAVGYTNKASRILFVTALFTYLLPHIAYIKALEY